MNRKRFGLLDTIESIPLETKKRLKKKCNNNNDEQGGNDKKYVETTYSELKELRDEGKLIPGTMYRITDYKCTTAQEDTRSAGHQFDIIVTALSESVLSEDAKAIQHKFEMPEKAFDYLYEVPAVYNGIIEHNGELYHHYKCQNGNSIYLTTNFSNLSSGTIPNSDENGFPNYYTATYYEYSDEENVWYDGDNEGSVVGFAQDIREFSYFSNSNLAAWKLKYCLDNDENRFAWAKNLYLSPVSHNKCIRISDGESYIYVRQEQLDNENGFAWAYDNGGSENMSIKNYANNATETLEITDVIYTQSENIYIGQILDMDGTLATVIDFSEEGKGVIYQMIDEYNNDCPYDFKNIQFLRSTGWHGEHTDWAEEVIGENPGRDIYYFTFSWINDDLSVEDVSVVGKKDDVDILRYAENNIINVYVEEIYSYRYLFLNNIILVSSYNTDVGVYDGTINNVFKYGCRNCTFGDEINNNVFDTGFTNNIMGNFMMWNKSFGAVSGIIRINQAQRRIIYYDSENDIIYYQSITAAFLDT